MAVLRQPGPILRNAKEDLLGRKTAVSEQCLALSIECVVGESPCAGSSSCDVIV